MVYIFFISEYLCLPNLLVERTMMCGKMGEDLLVLSWLFWYDTNVILCKILSLKTFAILAFFFIVSLFFFLQDVENTLAKFLIFFTSK